MKLSFDKFERYEMPQVMLCNPNSRVTEVDGKITISDTVGELTDVSGMNLKLNFNAPHELSFDYYRHKSDDPIKQSFYDNIYDSIQSDRYIYLTNVGYFTISGVTDNDEENIDKKSVSCRSCEENEFATAEGLYLEEGTYYLHTEDEDGLLDLLLPKTVGWTADFIDPTLLTKPYFVEKTEIDNGYNFLYTTIQDMFECIVEADIIHRKISVYSRAYYTEHHLTDIHIAKYNLLKHKTVEENGEDKYTALNVQGKDENIDIRPANPIGTNIIYNFESRYIWMSEELQEAVQKWVEKCDSVEEEYLDLYEEYYDEMQNEIFPLEQDIKVDEENLKQKIQTRDLIVYGDYDTSEYPPVQQDALNQVNAEINTLNTKIATEKSTLATKQSQIESDYTQPLAQINSDCALSTTAKDIHGQTIFTQELLNELMTHIKPTDYVDEYMIITDSMTYPERFAKSKELMDRAKIQLEKISSGKKSYSIDTSSFLFDKQFRHFSEQLSSGAIIYVETSEDAMEQLHLIGIDINYNEKSTNFTLGNKYDKADLKSLYEDALGNNSKTFTELKYIADIIENQQKQLDIQKNWPQELRQLTLDNVLTSEDQAIEINNRGLIGRKRQIDEETGEWAFDENGNPLFEDEQVKLINNNLIFTDDNWQTAKTSIGKIAVGIEQGQTVYKYGVNGEVIIGNLFLGQELHLFGGTKDDDGQYSISLDQNGLTIINDGTSAGIIIKDSDGNNQFYADENGNLVLSGIIQAQSGVIGGWALGHPLDRSGGFDSNVIALYRSGSQTSESGSGMASSVYASDPAFWAGCGGDSPWGVGSLTDSWKNYVKFYVGQDGYLYSTSGNIAGWDILASRIEQYSNGNRVGMQSSGGTAAFYAGCSTAPGGTIADESLTKFYVTHAGALHCTDASISGSIYATGGNIAGWIVEKDDYLGILYHPPITDSSGNRAGGTGIAVSTTNNDPVFYAGYSGYWSNPWKDSNWSSLTKFYVTGNGDLHAKNATISGTIQAGTIFGTGGFSVKNGYLGTLGLEIGAFGTNQTATSFEKGYLSAQWQGDSIESARWYAVVFAANEWDQGSDRRLKNSIRDFSNEYEILFDNLKPKSFKYNEGKSNRTHSGFIAQEVVDAIKISGLTTQDFAAPCLLNYGTDHEGYWWLRRDEFVALNTWQIQKCKSRISELESTVAYLKNQIQSLTA